MSDPRHIPVLTREVLAALAPRPGETSLDATAGLGGHAALIAPLVAPGGRVILNDLDPGNLERAAVRVRAVTPGLTVDTRAGNFADLPWRLAEDGGADLVLADLGFSSNQMDEGSRGFSFMREGPLDMRLDPSAPITAAELVNTLPEAELARILHEFGEEPGARRIARKIAQARRESPITTTSALADVVRSALGPRAGGRIDPATRSFQGLRIAVNDEMGALDAFLAGVRRSAQALAVGKPGGWLRPGARVGIISFHSLEDRRVKRAFGELVRAGWAEELTRGPVEAGPEEVSENPRSRSAKLRAVRLPGVTPRPESLS
jgi:16S rRNA (cytosine1402-N4)-methyltransferase